MNDEPDPHEAYYARQQAHRSELFDLRPLADWLRAGRIGSGWRAVRASLASAVQRDGSDLDRQVRTRNT